MQPSSIGHIPRPSSSSALSIAQQKQTLDAIYDDLTIAHGLLHPSRHHRLSSNNDLTISQQDGLAQLQNTDEPAVLYPDSRQRRAYGTSNTWTSSSGDVLSDQDEVDDRTVFIQEYNRLAKKHGIRMINSENRELNDESVNTSTKSSGWFSRKILRRTSSTQSVKPKPIEKQLKHKRSLSDLSLRLKVKKDRLKDKDLQELARLCGQSLLYLPTEYAAGSLSVPTCFRATAQYLVQHGINARGVFRIPGSHNTVMALYNHYCFLDEHGEAIAGTVRCPTLPEHIRCDVYDVASAFKKFLSGLPGGILGSLPLFDAFISIQTQLNGSPELTKTKQSKVRARLLALAIATIQSQYRRELICAVFGLLCMIGRTSETARREDEHGRPLPTADLMGYTPLGIIFGPLLLGDLLEDYTMHLANPHSGLVLLPIGSPKSRKETKKEKQKRTKISEEGAVFNTHVDKVKVANGIAEMLITHWRDIVRHMRNLSALKVVSSYKSLSSKYTKAPILRPSASETFAIRKPPDWDNSKKSSRRMERSVSPTPTGRMTAKNDISKQPEAHQSDTLQVRKQRSRTRPISSQRLSGARSLSILSPTVEESIKDHSDQTEHHSSHLKETYITSSSSSMRFDNSMSAYNHKISNRKDYLSNPSTSDKENEPPQQGENQSHHIARDKVIGAVQQRVMDTENRLALPILIPITAPRKLIKQQKDVSSPRKSPKFKRNSMGSFRQKEAQITFESQNPNQSRGRTSTKPEHKASNSHDYPAAPRRPSSLSRERERNQDKYARQIGKSEPGRILDIPKILETVRPSRSLYDSPKLKHNLTDSPNKEADSRVSLEEGLGSVSTPSQTLTLVDQPAEIDSDMSFSKENIHSPASITKSPVQCKQMPPSTAKRTSCTKGSPVRNAEPRRSPNTLSPNISQSVLQAQQTPQRKAISTPVVSPNRLSLTKHSMPITVEITSISNRVGSTNIIPRSPSKISALVAKFNNPESEALIPASLSGSPFKSPARALIADDAEGKQSIIAPYTTNFPSPTRSRTTSTPQSNQNLTHANNRPAFTPVKSSTPCRVLRASLDDPRPLRPVHRTPEASRTPSLLKPSNPFAINLRPVRSSLEVPSAKLGSQTPRPLAIGRVDGSSDEQPNSVADHTTSESLSQSVVALPSTKASLTDQCNDLVNKSGSEPFPILRSFDGPSSATSLNSTQLPRAEPPPVAHHVRFARPTSHSRSISGGSGDMADFVHPDSPFKEVFAALNPDTPQIPHRSNSLLFSQVRQLQQQLATKTEELQHLRRELESKQNLDIGTLSEQLREAKRETQIWKTRAEAAEKQVGILDRISLRSNSHYAPSRSNYHYDLTGSNFQYERERLNTKDTVIEGDMVDRQRKAFQSMDGTAPPDRCSEETTDTVVREIDRSSEGSTTTNSRELESDSDETIHIALEEISGLVTGSDYSM